MKLVKQLRIYLNNNANATHKLAYNLQVQMQVYSSLGEVGGSQVQTQSSRAASGGTAFDEEGKSVISDRTTTIKSTISTAPSILSMGFHSPFMTSSI